jgi:hypothetical protein
LHLSETGSRRPGFNVSGGGIKFMHLMVIIHHIYADREVDMKKDWVFVLFRAVTCSDKR